MNLPREEVQRRWSSDLDGDVTFVDAPGDRGTEVHVTVDEGNKLVEGVRSVIGTPQLEKAKDELRRFKQRVETGEMATAGS